jgi:hypothetical protein
MMGNSTQRSGKPSEQTAQYILDRLMQDLTAKLLPILRNGNKLQVEATHGGDCNELIKLKISEFIN